MQKSGSGWYFNLTNDLLVAAGYQDVRITRQRFHLQSILKHHNCNIGQLTPLKLACVAVPHFYGNTFVVKTHSRPSMSLRFLMSLGIVKATYIYRDLRDVVVSGFEHGQKIREEGETHTFAEWDSFETAVFIVKRLLPAWEEWIQCDHVLIVRYEDLLAAPINELERLVDFLSLDRRLKYEDLLRITSTYQPDKLDVSRANHLHFNRGVIGRYREVMSQEQLDLCSEHFGDYLQKMGYPE